MTFKDFNLNKPLWNALNDLAIDTPTSIQMKSFQPIMAGEDVVGIAQTGTGKTLAYLLPILRLWKFSKSANPSIMIVVPTRELVAQLIETVETLTSYMNFQVVGVYGGANIRVQKEKVSEGLDMIVGTPGRLVDLLRDNVLKAKELKHLVIDEVDEMLNLGFRTQLRDILDFMPKRRQHLMFSATITDDVEKIIQEFTAYYLKVEAAPSGAPLDQISQYFYSVHNFNSKLNLLIHLLASDQDMSRVLIFVSSKRMADALYERLSAIHGESIAVIHGSKSQNYRFRSVDSFQSGDVRCLIATDLISRGLDISHVTHVINFTMPEIAERYVHRIGRSGRADQHGKAISFIAQEEEQYRSAAEKLMDISITQLELPNEVELTDELISLEQPSAYIPYNVHKQKKVEPSGPAFHERSAKNQKTNTKISYKEKMKRKYGKPKTKSAKRK